MAVSKRVRYEVLRRDGHACRYCGSAAPDVVLTVDHVVPVALGGSNDPSNLATACQPCNAGKTSTTADSPIVADVDARAALWAEAMEIAAHGRRVARDEHNEMCEFLHHHWEGSRPNRWSSSELPADWENSIRAFIEAGLDVEDLTELMTVSLTTRSVSAKWKYFCGCCWKRVRESQELAARIVTRMEGGGSALGDEQAEADDSGFDEDFYRSYAADRWQAASEMWLARTGTRMRPCRCTEPCSDYQCILDVASMALGALRGVDQLIGYISETSVATAQLTGAVDGA
ncbi:HNH endonuclease [Nocardia sp. NPDC049149]|uniref:HNH endonuclease n=1 Tax=Nocardia sp. NPDC049149 TaxID=3364315 RepID=UPI0037105C53